MLRRGRKSSVSLGMPVPTKQRGRSSHAIFFNICPRRTKALQNHPQMNQLRPLLIAIMLMALYSTSSAQVRKYRAFQTKYYRIGDSAHPWSDVNILVVINVDKNSIQIYSATEQNIDIIKTTQDTYKEKDHWLAFEAVDGDGTKCEIDYDIFKTPDPDGWMMNLILDYGNKYGFIIYKLRQAD